MQGCLPSLSKELQRTIVGFIICFSSMFPSKLPGTLYVVGTVGRCTGLQCPQADTCGSRTPAPSFRGAGAENLFPTRLRDASIPHRPKTKLKAATCLPPPPPPLRSYPLPPRPAGRHREPSRGVQRCFPLSLHTNRQTDGRAKRQDNFFFCSDKAAYLIA